MTRPLSIPQNYLLYKGTWCHRSRVPREMRLVAQCINDDAPPTHAKAPRNDSVVVADTKTPKTPEDRLNKTEREFLSRLRNGVYGSMRHIGIQSLTLQLGFDCRYTPDFWTRMQGGDFRLWEVKGFMRDDARVKLYAAARMFPFWTFVLVQKVKGEWQERIIEQ